MQGDPCDAGGGGACQCVCLSGEALLGRSEPALCSRAAGLYAAWVLVVQEHVVRMAPLLLRGCCHLAAPACCCLLPGPAYLEGGLYASSWGVSHVMPAAVKQPYAGMAAVWLGA